MARWEHQPPTTASQSPRPTRIKPNPTTNNTQKEDYLDSSEQEELLSEFKRQHAAAQRQWRALWAAAAIALALLHGALAQQQLWHPWETRHDACFRGKGKWWWF